MILIVQRYFFLLSKKGGIPYSFVGNFLLFVFDNKNKNFDIYFVLSSLIRNFDLTVEDTFAQQ